MKNEEYTKDGKLDIDQYTDDIENETVINSSKPEDAAAAEANEDASAPSLSGLEEYRETVAFIDEDLAAYHNSDAPDDESDDVNTDNYDADEVSDEDEDVENENDAEIELGEDESAEDESIDEDSTAESETEEKKPRRVDALFDFIEISVFSMIGVFLLLSFFFRYTIVDGGSMMNTLHHGDRLLLASFLYTPECGDIVVIQDKSTTCTDPIVKRIIAIGGQTVKFTRYAVYVDGEKLEETYVYTGDYENSLGQPEAYRYSVSPHDSLSDYVIEDNDDTCYSVLVPEGMVFVMGDHRNNSKDSREIGLIHEDAIIGKAIYRFFPLNQFGRLE